MPNKTTEAINSYITDMLALEDHIEKALRTQIEDLEEDYPEFIGDLQRVHVTVEGHISTLKLLAEERDAGAGKAVSEAVKRGVSILAGVGAAAIDLVRSEKLPKDIRDDYTAASLATIGYVMLHTVALSLGDRPVADVAHRHLADYAKVTMTLHNIVPRAVIRFLKEEGHPAREDALDEIAENIESVWRDHSGVPDADERAGTRG